MSSQFNRERVIELVGRLCDDEISEDEVSELETIFKQHAEARRLYHLTVSLHRDLESCDIVEAQSVATRSQRRQTVVNGLATRSWVSIAVAASLLIAVSFFGLRSFRSENSTVQAIATVTDAVDVKWGSEQSAIGIGDGVPTGRIQLTSWTVCLTFQHGVVMTVESPADFEIVDKEHVTLHDGRIVAYVPDGAEGFTVTTDAAEVIDLGTEFAVTASKDGSSDVIVFDGEVELAARNTGEPAPQRVVAGLAYHVDRDGEAHQQEFRQSAFENARTMIRRRKVIREPFRNDRAFPGEAKNGWASPWSFEPINLLIDEQASGIYEETPLATGSRNYFTVVATSESNEDPGSLRLARTFDSFDQFNAQQPYTIEFLMRLESDPAVINQIRVFGVQAAVDPADWEIVTRKQPKKDNLRWQLYRPDDMRTNTLNLIQSNVYRFLIEVDPQGNRWRASISDGTQAIWNTLRNGRPLRLHGDKQADRNTLGWEFQVAPGSTVRFSLDAIRIQNTPSATTTLESNY